MRNKLGGQLSRPQDFGYAVEVASAFNGRPAWPYSHRHAATTTRVIDTYIDRNKFCRLDQPIEPRSYRSYIHIMTYTILTLCGNARKIRNTDHCF